MVISNANKGRKTILKLTAAKPYTLALSRYIQRSNSNAMSNGVATTAWHGAQ
jgi:hypothetical protein